MRVSCELEGKRDLRANEYFGKAEIDSLVHSLARIEGKIVNIQESQGRIEAGIKKFLMFVSNSGRKNRV